MTILENYKWDDILHISLITRVFPEPIIADPTEISVEMSQVKKWHLCAYGIRGLYNFITTDKDKLKVERILL